MGTAPSGSDVIDQRVQTVTGTHGVERARPLAVLPDM